MDCKFLEKVSLLVDDRLPRAEMDEVREHLATCDDCQTAQNSFMTLRRQIKSAKFRNVQVEGRHALERILRKESASRVRWFVFPSPRIAVVGFALALLVIIGGVKIYDLRNTKSWEVTRLEGAPKAGAKRIENSGRLGIGEWLETDDSSRARIKVASIGFLEVDTGTRLRLIETRADEHRIELARGEVRATISAPPRIFFVNTPSATVVDYGCAYTLSVDDEGNSVLHVTEGWVALVLNNRQSLVPASAYCKTKHGVGPGTPFFEDASGKFTDALTRFDFEQGGSSALDVILAEARKRDALSLWYLLQRTVDADRSRVYDALVRLVPLPEGVTREGVVRLDQQMLDVWKETIEIVSVGESFSAHTDVAAPGKLDKAGSMVSPRAGHTATLLPDGRVLIAGGMQRDDNYLSSAELYDPVAGSFSLTGSMSFARMNHTATLLPNGKVLIVGGSDQPDHPLASAELFDPGTGKFTLSAPLNSARSAHRATILNDGRVLITGGGGSNLAPLDSAELYEPDKDVFVRVGRMNVPRSAHTATLLNNGAVLLTGGIVGSSPTESSLASAELYDPSSGSFKFTGNMNTARYSHAAILLADGRVLISGGSASRGWKGRLAGAELYDPHKGAFAATDSMSMPRFNHQAAVVLLNDGKVLIAGSGARVDVYDPAVGSFRSAAGNVGTGRAFATATMLGNGTVLIAGGYNLGYSPTPSVWLYLPGPPG